MVHYNFSNRSSVLFFSLVLVALLLVPHSFSRSVSAVSAPTGMIIPLYSYPGTMWDTVITAKQEHPSVPIAVVINPDNGPGNFKDTYYVTGIQKLQSAGIVVLGYVYTASSTIPFNTVTTYIDNYKNWYNVSGIFFDQMSYVAGNETYYQNLTNYAKSHGFTFTMGNPGTDTLPSYIGTVDNIIIHENSTLPSIQSLGGWHTNYTKSNFSIVSYGRNNLDQLFVNTATNYVGYIYLTDGTLPNPFGSLPSYFGNFVAFLDTLGTQNTNTIPISPVKSSDITENHLDNGNTNQTITTMLTQNTTLPAYYKVTTPVEGFSNMTCKSGTDYVLMTGQYTAGNIPYKVIFLRMALLDNNGNVLATGTGHVGNVEVNKTITFNAITRYPSTFSSCTIQIDNAIPNK